MDACANLSGDVRLADGVSRLKKKRRSARTHRAKKAAPLRVDPVIEAYKKDIDRTLIRESLKLTPEQRLNELMELQRFAEELRKAPRYES